MGIGAIFFGGQESLPLVPSLPVPLGKGELLQMNSAANAAGPLSKGVGGVRVYKIIPYQMHV